MFLLHVSIQLWITGSPYPNVITQSIVNDKR